MATDGFGNYLVRVTDSVLSATILMTPIDARAAVAIAPGRYTALDPFVQPTPSPSPLTPFLGSFTIANLPTALPSGVGLPVGTTAIVSNGVTAPVMGAVPGTTGAVVCEVVWNGTAWGYG